MDELLPLFVFLFLVLCAAVPAGLSRLRHVYERQRAQLLAARRAAEDLHRRRVVAHGRRKQREATIARLGRELQIPLLQLGCAHDFRRAAAFAKRAKPVPLSFRRRQFTRFRAGLVERLATLLAEGGDRETLVRSLTELVRGLGMAGYEASYILAEAEAQLRGPDIQPPSLEDRLRQVHREHAQRVQAIRHVAELEDDVREQLIEAEEQRFADEMLRTAEPNDNEDLTH
jgi:hypothetical protein